MPACEFGEGQFEQDLMFEFRFLSPRPFEFFRPTQVMEEKLGFDFAFFMSQGSPGPWRTSNPLMGRPLNGIGFGGLLRAPSGTTLPARIASVFIQTKVPYLVTRKDRRTEDRWAFWRADYFRIGIDNKPIEQHSKLMALEKQFRGTALVRYAAPAFIRWSQLSVHAMAWDLIRHTHFQSPCRIGDHWTYTYRSAFGRGCAFSEPVEVDAPQFLEEVLRSLRLREDVTLAVVLREAWDAAVGLIDLCGPLEVTDGDHEAAALLLGPQAEQALPEEAVRVWERTSLAHERGRVSLTLGDLGAVVFSLDRYFHRNVGCTWMLVV